MNCDLKFEIGNQSKKYFLMLTFSEAWERLLENEKYSFIYNNFQ